MTGPDLAFTDRDRQVLEEVARFGAVTREQLMRLGVFASKTRANERLRRLAAAGYLAKRSQPMVLGGPRQVYLPGRQSESARVSRPHLVAASDLFLSHQLGLVDLRIAFLQATAVTRWLSDKDLSGMSLGLVPDAYVEYVMADLTYCAFVEYDRGTETLRRFQTKVHAYLDLASTGRFERTLRRRFFRVLVVTDTEGRLATLSHAVRTLTDQVFWLATKPAVTTSGPLAAIWRRPGGTQLTSLTSP